MSNENGPRGFDTIRLPLTTDVRMRNHRSAIERLELLADYVTQHAGTTSLNITEVAERIRDNVKLLNS